LIYEAKVYIHKHHLDTEFIQISVDDIDKVDTGDIVLFRTYTSYDLAEFLVFIVSPVIFSENYWSHAGMVVKWNGKVYLYESEEEPDYDNMLNKIHVGVRLSNYNDRLSKYNGDVAILKSNLSNDQKRKIEKCVHKFKGVPFIKSPMQMMKISSDPHTDGLNCIQTVIKTLQDTDIMHKNVNPLNFSALWSNTSYNHEFKIKERYKIKVK
jgi:hypothetical protein